MAPPKAKGKNPDEAATPPPIDGRAGLCARCLWVRAQPTKRGSVFYRCARADEDPAYLQYPPIPVLQCEGFDQASR